MFDHMGLLKMVLPLSATESPLPNNPRYIYIYFWDKITQDIRSNQMHCDD